MNKYLLAAEADRIQDFIFRAAHLREVVGGSQLLTRFCNEVPGKLLAKGSAGKIVVSDGGSFRVIIEGDDAEKAREFGRQLAEVYRLTADGSLTVIDPPIEVIDYQQASAAVEQALRLAKRRKAGGVSPLQLPYVAFCASCGVGLAQAHDKRLPVKDERPQYLCAACRVKGIERHEHQVGEFLEKFFKAVSDKFDADNSDWPGKDRRKDTKEREPTEDVADYDARGYVAYLLADGNGMGRIFSQCNQEQVTLLSQKLPEALRAALAEPTRQIMKWAKPGKEWFIPVLPLILGGDDLFALIPAPWAVDFARRFCETFQAEMETVFEDPLFAALKQKPDFRLPTISAAVVICKSNYPFALAHEVGEERLAQTKRMAKAKPDQSGAVNFEVILGSQVGGETEAGSVRRTLRPYWIGAASQHQGVNVEAITAQRWELRMLANKRRAQLRELYHGAPDDKQSAEWAAWSAEQARLLKRIQRDARSGAAVKTALAALGGDQHGWYEIDRVHDSGTWLGHGLPDLIELWDFSFKLAEDPRKYEEV